MRLHSYSTYIRLLLCETANKECALWNGRCENLMPTRDRRTFISGAYLVEMHLPSRQFYAVGYCIYILLCRSAPTVRRRNDQEGYTIEQGKTTDSSGLTGMPGDSLFGQDH